MLIALRCWKIFCFPVLRAGIMSRLEVESSVKCRPVLLLREDVRRTRSCIIPLAPLARTKRHRVPSEASIQAAPAATGCSTLGSTMAARISNTNSMQLQLQPVLLLPLNNFNTLSLPSVLFLILTPYHLRPSLVYGLFPICNCRVAVVPVPAVVVRVG